MADQSLKHRKQIVLSELQQGSTLPQASARIGVNVRTVRRWREADRGFDMACKRIIAARKNGGENDAAVMDAAQQSEQYFVPAAPEPQQSYDEVMQGAVREDQRPQPPTVLTSPEPVRQPSNKIPAVIDLPGVVRPAPVMTATGKVVHESAELPDIADMPAEYIEAAAATMQELAAGLMQIVAADRDGDNRVTLMQNAAAAAQSANELRKLVTV